MSLDVFTVSRMSSVGVTYKEVLIGTIPSGNTISDSFCIPDTVLRDARERPPSPLSRAWREREVMSHFVDEQPEAREVKELAFDVQADRGRAVALIKACLTQNPRSCCST